MLERLQRLLDDTTYADSLFLENINDFSVV